MSDDSEQVFPSRLACEGELLVTHRFPTEWIGFASALDMDEAERRRARAERGTNCLSEIRRWFMRHAKTRPISAVCLPPGARLRMTHIPADLRRRWLLRTVEDVRFTVTGDLERYRDAIRFANGKMLLLQMIPERVCFMVLSMGSDESATRVRMPIWRDDVSVVDDVRGS
jgi:hypothetical protein